MTLNEILSLSLQYHCVKGHFSTSPSHNRVMHCLHFVLSFKGVYTVIEIGSSLEQMSDRFIKDSSFLSLGSLSLCSEVPTQISPDPSIILWELEIRLLACENADIVNG